MPTFLVERTHHTLHPAKHNEDVQHVEHYLVEAPTMPAALRLAEQLRFENEDERGWVDYLKSKYGMRGSR